jgi:prepilin peptidase CpaA
LSLSFPPPLIAATLLTLVTVAAAFDIRSRRIPNWLTAAGVVLGVALNTFQSPIWTGLRFSLTGLLLALVIYMALYALRAMGAGDVKLMAAIASLVGWQNWTAIFLITALIGGAAALVLVASRGRVRKTLWNVTFILSEMKSGRPAYIKNEELDVRSPEAVGLPHGDVIAVGTAVFLAIGTSRAHALVRYRPAPNPPLKL